MTRIYHKLGTISSAICRALRVGLFPSCFQPEDMYPPSEGDYGWITPDAGD